MKPMLEGITERPVNFEQLNEVKELNPERFEPLEPFCGTNDPETGEKPDHIYLVTRNECLEGTEHPVTGVPFERMTVDNIEGVFPRFESAFDAKIPEELYEESDYRQFKCCCEQLNEAIERDPALKAQFSPEQLQQIREGVLDGAAPEGYIWHHDVEPGKIQLVDSDIHAMTGHTGGRVVWGGGNENR